MYYGNLVGAAVEAEAPSWTTLGVSTGGVVVDIRPSGIEIGMREYEKIVENQHLSLRNTAVKISEAIYSHLKEQFKIKPVGMRMRTQGFSSFGTLFLLQADDFYSDKIEEIYAFLNQEKNKTTAIDWSFVLMAASNDLDESAMVSDGYILSYAERR